MSVLPPSHPQNPILVIDGRVPLEGITIDGGSMLLSEAPSTGNSFMQQPETQPISQEQLVAEVKGIYAGFIMAGSKCIEVDKTQRSPNETQALAPKQWQALIALHRTLLHEHHDFFLASQHPSASPALRRLASKYAMSARMWLHDIHSFLDLLQHRLPQNLEHMLTFHYLAYSMLVLLYETVPDFEDTWIECLGDISRYGIAIEDDGIRDRELWTGVSRHWYSKASDKAPTTGRLHHHLAILARPNAIQQLFYYTKTLCVPTPFISARESILALFDPIMRVNQATLPLPDVAFVKLHGILFTDKMVDQKMETTCTGPTPELEFAVNAATCQLLEELLEVHHHMPLCNIAAILDFGTKVPSMAPTSRYSGPQALSRTHRAANDGILPSPWISSIGAGGKILRHNHSVSPLDDAETVASSSWFSFGSLARISPAVKGRRVINRWLLCLLATFPFTFADPSVRIRMGTLISGTVSGVTGFSALRLSPVSAHGDDAPGVASGVVIDCLSTLSMLFALPFVLLLGLWLRGPARLFFYFLQFLLTVILCSTVIGLSGRPHQWLDYAPLLGNLSGLFCFLLLRLVQPPTPEQEGVPGVAGGGGGRMRGILG